MKRVTHIDASVSIHVSICVRPNRAALKETVDSEQDYFRMRQDGGPRLEGSPLDCIITCGVDSFGLKHLNYVDTFPN